MIHGSVDLIALAFNVFNFLRLAFYFPQIVAVAREGMAMTEGTNRRGGIVRRRTRLLNVSHFFS